MSIDRYLQLWRTRNRTWFSPLTGEVSAPAPVAGLPVGFLQLSSSSARLIRDLPIIEKIDAEQSLRSNGVIGDEEIKSVEFAIALARSEDAVLVRVFKKRL